MVVKYSKGWAYTLLGLGVLCVVLYFLNAREAGHWGVIVAGGACLIIGTGYMVRPYFKVDEGRIVVHAVLGPAKRTYEYGPGELKLEGRAVWIVRGDDRTKVRVSRSLAAKDDWQAFLRTTHLID